MYTKLSIFNNNIYYIEPSLLQGVYRRFNGYSRDDLQLLYNPLVKCTSFYKLDSSINKYLYNEFIKGLDILIDTYDNSDTIHHTLVHYKSIINDFLDNKKIHHTFKNDLINVENIWNKGDIFIAYNIIKQIERGTNAELRNIHIQYLENIINHKRS